MAGQGIFAASHDHLILNPIGCFLQPVQQKHRGSVAKSVKALAYLNGMRNLSIQCLLADLVSGTEHAVRPSEARTDAASLILAEIAKGPAHGLHSKAPRLLSLVLQRDLLRPADLKVRTGYCSLMLDKELNAWRTCLAAA